MNFKEKLNKIDTFIFDIDGVLTDGSLILLPSGEQVRTMYIRDGYAIKLAVEAGYKVAVISGGKSYEAVTKRLNGLGVFDVFLAVPDKMDPFTKLLLSYNLQTENILYMGDDMPDYEVMTKVGIATCPNDAASQIKEISAYISPYSGGKGCVRDVIEQVLRLHGKWK